MTDQKISTVEAAVSREKLRAEPLSAEELAELDDLGRVHLAGLFPSWRECLHAPKALLAHLRSAALHLRS